MASTTAFSELDERTGAILVMALAIILSVALLFSYRVEEPPDNALVLTDSEKRTYASSPCVIFNRLEREMIANRAEVNEPDKPLQLLPYANEVVIGDVRGLSGWRRDSVCNYATGFDQIVTVWHRLLGLRARWSDDGQWRW